MVLWNPNRGASEVMDQNLCSSEHADHVGACPVGAPGCLRWCEQEERRLEAVWQEALAIEHSDSGAWNATRTSMTFPGSSKGTPLTNIDTSAPVHEVPMNEQQAVKLATTAPHPVHVVLGVLLHSNMNAMETDADATWHGAGNCAFMECAVGATSPNALAATLHHTTTATARIRSPQRLMRHTMQPVPFQLQAMLQGKGALLLTYH